MAHNRRKPQKLILDNGKPLTSAEFERIKAQFKLDMSPPTNPRHKALIEHFFGTFLQRNDIKLPGTQK